MGWIVVVTRPGDEGIAEQSIERAGHVAYVPRYRKTLRGAYIADDGRRRVRSRRRHIVHRPLLPGYLFAVDPGEDEAAIATATGVCRVLHCRLNRTRGPAFIVDDATIENIRREVKSGIWDQVDFLPGDPVRVGGGPLDGKKATLVAFDKNGSAHVLLDFLGQHGLRATVSAKSLLLPE